MSKLKKITILFTLLLVPISFSYPMFRAFNESRRTVVIYLTGKNENDVLKEITLEHNSEKTIEYQNEHVNAVFTIDNPKDFFSEKSSSLKNREVWISFDDDENKLNYYTYLAPTL